MEDPRGHDAVWAETEDGGLLHQLFGFYPTLHDARVRTVSYNRARDALEITLDYEDEAEGDRSLRARITFSFTGIRSIKMSFDDNFILGLQFHRRDALILTYFQGLGEVVAESVEAKLAAMDPLPDEPGKPIEFELS
ncbi:MAG TPA: hypothetical protein VKT78_13525 [Fimbriimonadaceae bacterium]|nr:hypothetical protein [Fimbriimonadaceae bacterium]